MSNHNECTCSSHHFVPPAILCVCVCVCVCVSVCVLPASCTFIVWCHLLPYMVIGAKNEKLRAYFCHWKHVKNALVTNGFLPISQKENSFFSVMPSHVLEH